MEFMQRTSLQRQSEIHSGKDMTLSEVAKQWSRLFDIPNMVRANTCKSGVVK